MQSPTLSPKRFAEAFAKKHPAPHAPREPKQEIFHGQTVEDNYSTLQRQSPESDAWLNAQEKRLQAYNAASPHHEEHIEILKESFNYVKESRPIFAGGKYFSILDDGKKQRSTVIVRDSLDGEPTTLIDPSEWEKDYPSTKYFHITDIKPSADGSRIIVSYSNAGLAPFAAILDVESKSYIESHKSDRDMKWMPGSNDTIIYGDWHEEEKHWCLRKHTINDSPDQDRTVFEFSSPERKHAAHLFIGSDKGKATHEFLTLRFGGSKDNGLYTRHLGEEGSFDLLFDDGESKALPIGEVDGKLLVYTDHDAPMGRVVAVDYANPSPDNWETVIAENSEHDLEGVSLVRGKLVAHYLENAQTRISLFEKDGRYIDDIPLPEAARQIYVGWAPMKIACFCWLIHLCIQSSAIFMTLKQTS